jgi:hypothetical protein
MSTVFAATILILLAYVNPLHSNWLTSLFVSVFYKKNKK